MSTREQRAQAMVDQVDDATARLLSSQLKLVRLASNKDKSIATLATETTEIEASTLSIERAVEDMLVISRSLKEAWVLGQIKEAHVDTGMADRHELVQGLARTLRKTDEFLSATN